MTHSTETGEPSSVDLPALRTWNQEARVRAAELRVQIETRRQQHRELTDRGGRSAAAASATELAELRARAETAERRADNLERALASNRRIGMAVGILLERLHVPEEQAFELLRQESMRRNIRLAQVAETVVYTGTL
ncbi:ANTAR domain-containing protein [Geodermatophilus siccatus]|uniref:ANTAR domain-containing protein n=1 Tax=Geodermatophilus siccatus TaxID=1137991 RepID=A0A1G9L5B9_9ACTN|nr:ANTAR domain-containing protein [Geodermatophilus siccatus]SDL57199.1 ANTAR domain-containing protein [Geodermatophilus siccatus]